MCGIVGAASNYLSDPEKDTFRNLLYASAVRGMDSTGVVSVQSKANDQRLHAPYIKSVFDSSTFLFHNGDHPVIFKPKESVHALIGHTRAATVGKVTKQNAHPFSFSKIIGVHNGTMRKKWGTEKNFETDSEALYDQINQRGIREVIKDIGRGSGVSDAYALVFFDKTEQTLNMIRNEERPLSITKTTGTIYWASEKRMLDWAVNREKGLRVVEEIKPYHLYTWKLGGAIKEPVVEDLTPPFKSSGYNRGWAFGGEDYAEFCRGDTTTQHVSSNSHIRNRPQNVVPRSRSKEIPMDGYVKVFNEKLDCWLLYNWMHPDRKAIVLNSDGTIPDGYTRKNGLLVPKEVTTHPVPTVQPVTPDPMKRPEPRNTDMAEQAAAQDSVDAKPVGVVLVSEVTKSSDPFERLRAFDKLFPENSKDGVQLSEGEDCKIVRISDRKPIRQMIADDNLYLDSNGSIIDENVLTKALEAGCMTCGNIFDKTDVCDHNNNVSGVLERNDTGGRNYTCIACIKDYYDQNPEVHPRIH